MSVGMRKRHDAAFKVKVALETIKKKGMLAQLLTVFSEMRKAGEQAPEVKGAEPYRQIGQLQGEVE